MRISCALDHIQSYGVGYSDAIVKALQSAGLTRPVATQLGFTVKPDQVRLQPRIDDGYAWIRQPEREHLFTKQLSKHSVGGYMELCRELGTSIEAMPHPDLTVTVCGPNLLCKCLAGRTI